MEQKSVRRLLTLIDLCIVGFLIGMVLPFIGLEDSSAFSLTTFSDSFWSSPARAESVARKMMGALAEGIPPLRHFFGSLSVLIFFP